MKQIQFQKCVLSTPMEHMPRDANVNMFFSTQNHLLQKSIRDSKGRVLRRKTNKYGGSFLNILWLLSGPGCWKSVSYHT